MSNQFIKSLCDEIDVRYATMLLISTVRGMWALLAYSPWDQ
jgi:hypothetical protein